jgi:hypothetical protein
MINDQSIGDDEVERVGIRLIGSLSLTVSKRLSSAEFTLVWGNVSSKVSTASDRGMRDSERTSVNREIVFHLDPKTCISQPGIETRVSAFAHDQKEVEEAAHLTRSPAVGPYIEASTARLHLVSHLRWRRKESRSSDSQVSLDTTLSSLIANAPGSSTWLNPDARRVLRSSSHLSSLSSTSPEPRFEPPRIIRLPPTATRVTDLDSPGSKRTAVPTSKQSWMRYDRTEAGER